MQNLYNLKESRKDSGKILIVFMLNKYLYWSFFLIFPLSGMTQQAIPRDPREEFAAENIEVTFSETKVTGGMTYVYATNRNRTQTIQCVIELTSKPLSNDPKEPPPKPIQMVRVLRPGERTQVFSAYVYSPMKAKIIRAEYLRPKAP